MTFPTTRWTLLAAATLHGDSRGREALASLCAGYRSPVAAYLAARGLPPGEIEDTVQDFFYKLLHSQAWKRADRARGRFRSFLLGVLDHMLQQNVRDRHRQKRGGGMVPESLDALLENGTEPAEAPPDAAVFDRAWALALVAEGMRTVEGEFIARDQAREFALLRKFLPGAQATPSYEESAKSLGLSLTALKSAIHRLRQRFREVLRTAVARTVSAPHEVDEELRYLGALLTRASFCEQPAEPNGKESAHEPAGA